MSALADIISPRPRDLGGFTVRRALPAPSRRNVGPFVFWDEMGPAEFRSGEGIDVRPHPHIGLATVTYLFEGELLHRDSLGHVQEITPGAVNWLTAGRGIVHSERTGEAARARDSRLHGIQSWVALPQEAEESEPDFVHVGADDLPATTSQGVSLRLIAGSAYGMTAPIPFPAPVFYVDALLPAGTSLDLPNDHEERALYPVGGPVTVGGEQVEASSVAVLAPGEPVTVTASSPVRLMLFGGAPLDAPRTIWWNFVSSSTVRIEKAKADWKAGAFPKVPGESEWIPLPES